VHLANNFSSEVLSWFIDISSEETTSSSSTSSSSSAAVSSSGESEELSSPSSLSEGYNLFLTVEDSASSSNLAFHNCWMPFFREERGRE
jgi:hypothetical protein